MTVGKATKRKPKIRDTFFQAAVTCPECRKKFAASTMDISAGSPIYCPQCGHEI